PRRSPTAPAPPAPCSLWVLGAGTIASTALGGLALWAIGGGRGLVPRLGWRWVERADVALAWRTGLHFLAIDASALILLRTPEVIVARLHGVAAVGPFASVGRMPALMLA